MIEIRYLQAESGANKFGTCNCCGKSSGEDPLMISIKFSYYGHGTLICLCDDCRKKLIEVLNGEQLPPANNSEIPNSSDMISRAKAIEALDEQIKQCDKSLSSFDISMKDEYAVKVEKASLVAFREILEYLPPAQLEPYTDALKAEIKRMKRSFTICINSDYYTGYMSALSAVEGYIAQMEVTT